MIEFRKPALADSERVGHHVVRVHMVVVEPEHMTHLVHQRGEQVHVTGGHAGRVGLQMRGGDDMPELEIVARGGVDEPAVAGAVVVDGDPAVGERGELAAAKIRDCDGYTIESGELNGREPGSSPAKDRSSGNRGEACVGDNAPLKAAVRSFHAACPGE